MIDYNSPVNRSDQRGKLKDAIYDFFGNRNIHPDDTLVFYYSGHGVLDGYGDTYLASSAVLVLP